jgi:hypothetical protein
MGKEAKMKPVYSIILATALAGSIGFAAVTEGPTERARARAARIMEGRAALDPIVCVGQRQLRGNQSLDEGRILFGGVSDRTVYVNSPPAGCPSLDNGRILITHTTGSQLCRGDIVTVRDPSGGPEVGSCGLGDFTPYRRAN